MEVFPAKLRKLWNSLELRVLVLLSLFLQIVLIATGNRRKYTRNRWLAAIIWLSYLSADAVATIALGVLSQASGGDDSENNNRAKSSLDHSYTIMAFWAPFLLLHLGGPDTITAYSLADNELWPRHLLGLVTQAGVAIYVLLRSWSGAKINYIWIVVFVAGLIKYGERTLSLFLASRDQFRESMVPDPDPGPDYAKLVDEFVSREEEGYRVSLSSAREIDEFLAMEDRGKESSINEDAILFDEAFDCFDTFRQLFADLILSFQDRARSLSLFRALSWEKAFTIVEIELGCIYDLLHTKTFIFNYMLPEEPSILNALLGLLLRVLSYASTVAAFIAFLIIDKKVYPKTEVIITHILLVVAILIEIYAITIFLLSDWGMTVFDFKRKWKDSTVSICVGKIVSLLRYLHIVPAIMRWSNAMGQYNVLNCCIESKPKWTELVRQFLAKYLFWDSVSVPKGLKALIFDELKTRSKCTDEKKSGGYRGDKILLEKLNYFDKDDIDTDHQQLEFDQSLLLWHMATDFCYYTDIDEEYKPDETWLSEFIITEESTSEDSLKFKREICKLLSNYMMHLLIMFPFMLPSGIGQIRFQDTRAEAIRFFDGQKLSERSASAMLLGVNARLPPSKVKGDRSKSLLFDACRLANSLKSSEFGDRKWDVITQAWLDMLTFAAAKCRSDSHAEKLSQGGELLTHVWLLMAHFGMTDHFQISQGYVRAKINLQ